MKARVVLFVAVWATMLTSCGMGSLLAQGTLTQVDPIAVQKLIRAHPDFNVASLWRSLGIPNELDTVYRKLGVAAPDSNPTFDHCLGDCVAEITRANLDADPTEEVVLKVFQRWGLCRFLIFKPVGRPAAGLGQWRFLGHADHDFARYYMPEHRAAVLGGKRYFVMAAQGVSGTGVSLQYDRWYEIEPAGMREILSLPARGGECRDLRSLCRDFESKVVTRSDTAQGEEFVVSFTVRYTGNYFLVNESQERDVFLLSRAQRAVYVRSQGSGNYSFAARRSDISMREIGTVFNIDTLTCKDFLVFNISGLAQIASNGDGFVKEWLARYVSQCDSSPERSRFLELLRR